jgi:phosphopantothenoylcysteine decarboxylase/phosphopantothenate--cysteine ligase
VNPPAKTALLGICGGVAAYKAVEVASRLRKAGWDVHVAMSDAARKFVTPLTFAAVSGNPVLESLFPSTSSHQGEALYPHLYPASRAGLFVLLPATADMIARVAAGLGNDIVSTCILSLPAACRRIFCPAMNVEMWNQPVVQANIGKLEASGWIRIGPNAGPLACGMEGQGRMAEPAEIERAIAGITDTGLALKGKKVLILSGPTREHLDPIRFLSNASSGKMGKALADEASALGAKVEFVTGPVPETSIPGGPGVSVHHVVSAEDMLGAARKLYADADLVLYAAAVADYRPAERHDKKRPKGKGAITLALETTHDVAGTLNMKKRKGQVAIGFALQTHDGLTKAGAKMAEKFMDGIVLNGMDALGGDSGTYTFLRAGRGGKDAVTEWGPLDKRTCARKILQEAVAALERR